MQCLHVGIKPKEIDVENIRLEEAIDWLNAKALKTGAKKATKKKKAAKKKTTTRTKKKSTKKKSVKKKK